MQSDITRERWLEEAVARLRPMYHHLDIPLPDKVRVSVGWPSKRGLAETNKRIGECWKATAAADEVPAIFISPILADPVRVLDVLVHELIHAAYPAAGHKGPFPKAMKKLGLEGKPTSTVAGADLAARLTLLATDLGQYPHAELRPLPSTTKSGGSRMIRCWCPQGCMAGDKPRGGWFTQSNIDAGLPCCADCGTPYEVKG